MIVNDSASWGIAMEKLVLALIALVPGIILGIEKLIAFKMKKGTCLKKETTDVEMLSVLKKLYPDATIEVLTDQLMKLKQQNYEHIMGEKKKEAEKVGKDSGIK